jgi:hypothetical protein
MSRGNRQRWSLRLTRWHRWAGIAAALFVVVLATTGIAVQHAPVLGLDERAVGNAAAARLLGIEAGDLRAYRAGERWVIGSGEAVFLGRKRLASVGPPRGAVTDSLGLAIAAGDDVLLVGSEGRLLERLRVGGALPGRVQRIGRGPDGKTVIATPSGRFSPQRDWLAFSAYSGPVTTWSEPETPPPGLASGVRARILGRAVTWERLLLSLHSGRIAGTAGVVVMDAAAIGLLLLAGTGLYLWWRRR